MDTTRPAGNIDARETRDLIGSDKVEGTPVYRSDGTRIGRVERLMIDKNVGTVAYAVMSFGGFIGLGKDHYPLPWSLLTYNQGLGGYECNVPESRLQNAPKYADEATWMWSDLERGRSIQKHYGVD